METETKRKVKAALLSIEEGFAQLTTLQQRYPDLSVPFPEFANLIRTALSFGSQILTALSVPIDVGEAVPEEQWASRGMGMGWERTYPFSIAGEELGYFGEADGEVEVWFHREGYSTGDYQVTCRSHDEAVAYLQSEARDVVSASLVGAPYITSPKFKAAVREALGLV